MPRIVSKFFLRRLTALVLLAPLILASQGLPDPMRGVLQETAPAGSEFYFTRAVFSGPLKRGLSNGRMITIPAWSADYPKSDEQFLTILRRLIDIDATSSANAIRLDDPELRRFPLIYGAEVGLMEMTPTELEGLRGYLTAGGFLMVDDFWGSRDWFFFTQQLDRLFPDREIKELLPSHPLFHSVYEIPKVQQVPNLDNLRRGRTFEADGITARLFGIFDDDGRLMVALNWNTDLGDAWEWAESPEYPLKYSTYASEIAINTILYVMTH